MTIGTLPLPAADPPDTLPTLTLTASPLIVVPETDPLKATNGPPPLSPADGACPPAATASRGEPGPADPPPADVPPAALTVTGALLGVVNVTLGIGIVVIANRVLLLITVTVADRTMVTEATVSIRSDAWASDPVKHGNSNADRAV
jgi:hypothetical protein